jgi:2-iminoacetate synthase ThiH
MKPTTKAEQREEEGCQGRKAGKCEELVAMLRSADRLISWRDTRTENIENTSIYTHN